MSLDAHSVLCSTEKGLHISDENTRRCFQICLRVQIRSINDPAKLSEVFNDFFINVEKNIGNTNVIVNKEHPSVCMIKENKLITDDLNFKR